MTKTQGIPASARNSIVVARRSKRLLGGFLAGMMLVGMAATAVAAPMMDPGPLAPVGRLVQIEATKAARGAYVDAQLQNGYVLTPSMQLAE